MAAIAHPTPLPPGSSVNPNNLPPPGPPPDPEPDGRGRMVVMSENRRGAKPPAAKPTQEAPRRFAIGGRRPSLFTRVEHPRAERDPGLNAHLVPPTYSR